MPASELSKLELAAGVVWGGGASASLPSHPPEPGRALQRACVGALRRPPCLVSFSGGGDSSAVLAAAVNAAREEGLPSPVPVSLRFPAIASADESRWQEMVIAHLGLSDWVRVDIRNELDFLGPLARAGLRRHGLLWPANAHFHAPIFERAAGGSTLTGADGDGLLGAWRWRRAQAVLTRAALPEPRDALRVALALAPGALRRAALSLRRGPEVTWLTPGARRRFGAALAREQAAEPREWSARVAWFAARRHLEVGLRSLSLLAGAHDVQVHHPLLDPVFLSAVAAVGGQAGFGSRLEATRVLFGDLLPGEVVERRTKAEFGLALWGPEARAFATQWDGIGLDSALVDLERLRATWSLPNPPLATATLLQEAWLSAFRRTSGSPQPTP